MDSALRCPYKPFKLGLGGKQVTRYTREKCYGILSCFSIIIIINSNISFTLIENMAFGTELKSREMDILKIRYISGQINEIVEAVLPLQKSSVDPHDSFYHIHTHTYRHTMTLPLWALHTRLPQSLIKKAQVDAKFAFLLFLSC